ncbi:ABC transporter ATP-binding protein [Halorussus salilacus]|uniref:ABC transporter ATP-binding protein n=1 Tax=Halorussus salilacus TaxID=2953750 RepID=UPI0020A14E76|nr:ABC transporter ATP-binding protein [Halorussus salilacus]USZ68736.1 ABC transporter ATP-binding protein [Halorussus salilacus]
MADALVADGVRKEYGDTAALDGVSLSVGEGEVFALIGPNGAGKTTLVRALTGTTTPDAGSVSVFGDRPQTVERSRLGLLPQSFDPPERLTARELVAYYAGLYDESRDPDAVLAEVGLDADGTWYENLSGGQKRRACVGTALVNDPDVLFLDEPTTGIDPGGRRALWALIEDLAAAGTTVFLTTHYMAEAERLADRVGLLAAGRLVAVGSPADLVAEHGGASRIVVDVTGDASASVAAATDALAGTGFDAEATGRGLVVPGVGPEDIGDIVAALDGGGVAYDALAWKQPDLEDAFLELTGRSVASGGPTGLGGVETEAEPSAEAVRAEGDR